MPAKCSQDVQSLLVFINFLGICVFKFVAGAQGIAVILHLGLTPGSALEVLCGVIYQSGIGQMQDKHFSHCSISLALKLVSLGPK